MKNALFKVILWCVGVLAISAITVIIIYRLAYFIAIILLLLLLGALIGPPLVMVGKSKYKTALRKQAKKYDWED